MCGLPGKGPVDETPGQVIYDAIFEHSTLNARDGPSVLHTAIKIISSDWREHFTLNEVLFGAIRFVFDRRELKKSSNLVRNCAFFTFNSLSRPQRSRYIIFVGSVGKIIFSFIISASFVVIWQKVKSEQRLQ